MVFASVLALSAFVFAILLPNIGLMMQVFNTSSASFATKLKVGFSLLGGISTNFTVLSAGYTIAIAILFGLNTTMVVYLIRKRRRQFGTKTLAVGLGGIGSGLLGIGCASCGAFLLTAIFSSLGAIGILSYFPLKGGELGILGVILLLFSLLLISKKITEPLICKT